ncbi:MAG: nucleotidyltransferase domain-containing protein, partial [Candidatus Thermoplasmatota archaeon]
MSKKNERYNTDDDLVKSIKKGVSKVCKDYDVVAAYLYGSFARGEQHQGSDVDIGIYFEDYSLKKLLEMSRKIQGEVDLS